MQATVERFEWRRQPEAEALVQNLLEQLVAAVPPLQELQADMLAQTSTHLYDWLDHLVLADSEALRGQLAELGFVPEEVPAEPGDVVYFHPGAILPRLVLRARNGAQAGTALTAAVQVEQVSDFLMTQQMVAPIEGSLLSPYRRARIWEEAGREVWVVERRGHAGFVPREMPADYAQRYLRAYERWVNRPRRFADPRVGLQKMLDLAHDLAADVGTDTAAWIAFSAERAYWQSRNRAGQAQKSRQDRLGLGWANHDHHTFRSSREAFPLLIRFLETLGFRPRERFYAGAEAGWGAQVMEQPVARFAVFADVDLSPEEVSGDFAHSELPPREELGTVGLWCALHGESALSAGLHHLAGRFDFDAATAALADWGVEMMAPFSEFSYLQQAFSKGERWTVDAGRLERLCAAGRISERQYGRFLEKGAVGSHLENIQRAEGFKGFNQQTVSDIIRRTDPRAGNGMA